MPLQHTSAYATGSLHSLASPTLQCFSPCILLSKQTEEYGKARPLNWLLLSELPAMASALFSTWLFHTQNTQSHSSCKATQGRLSDIHCQATLSSLLISTSRDKIKYIHECPKFCWQHVCTDYKTRSLTQSLLLMHLAIMLLITWLNWLVVNR